MAPASNSIVVPSQAPSFRTPLLGFLSSVTVLTIMMVLIGAVGG